MILVLSLSLAPGPVSDITSFSSFFTITITWEQPAMPNGVLRDYRVEYGLRDSTQTTEEDVPDTTFTTPNTLERGNEYIFTVTASTGAGLGTPTTVNVFTLDKPRKMINILLMYCVYFPFSCIYSYCRRSDGSTIK